MKPDGRRKRNRQLTTAKLDAIEETTAARRTGSAGYGTESDPPRQPTPKQRAYLRSLERETGAEPLPGRRADLRLELSFCVAAVREALECDGPPEIWNHSR